MGKVNMGGTSNNLRQPGSEHPSDHHFILEDLKEWVEKTQPKKPAIHIIREKTKRSFRKITGDEYLDLPQGELKDQISWFLIKYSDALKKAGNTRIVIDRTFYDWFFTNLL